MKVFAALALFAVTASAFEDFQTIVVTTLEGVVGDATTPTCVAAFEDAVMDAYWETNPTADTNLMDVVTLEQEANYLTSGTTATRYRSGYDWRCRGCSNGLLAASLTIENQAAFELMLKNKLIASSSCPAFSQITSVSVTEAPPGALGTSFQEYETEVTTDLDGVVGDISSTECIAAFEQSVVTAYSEINPTADAKLWEVVVESETPSVVGYIRVGTTGKTTSTSRYSWSCRGCSGGRRLAMSSLITIDNKSAVESALMANLIGSNCPAFSSLTAVVLTEIAPSRLSIDSV